MDKAYSRIVWQNQPSTATALGATNLNKMDVALNAIDDRVVGMDVSKANQDTVNNVVESITYNESTGVLTIKKVNGTSTNIDTKLEKLAVNFSYDSDEQQLIIALDDGTMQYVDMSALVTQYEFLDTDTIAFALDGGKIKAEIINGSVTGDMLQPNYLADIIVQTNISVTNANLSKRYAVGGVEEGDATDNAKYYKEQAEIAAAEAEEIAGFDPLDYYKKNEINDITGDLSQLETESNTDLVGAINENTNKLGDILDYGTFIQPESVELIKSLIEKNEYIRVAILGDSTECGAGARESTYGECGDILQPTSHERFALNLIMSSPYFIKPDPSLGGELYYYNRNQPVNPIDTLLINYEHYTLVKSAIPNFTLNFRHKRDNKRDKLSVYYLRRKSNAAPTFDVVCNGITTTIDTYKPDQSFGTVTGIAQQGFAIGVTEISIPTTSDVFNIDINNVKTVDRGSGVAADGTAFILGFYYGNNINFRNFAIGSTTLKNDSASNIARGITTDERLQKAYDFGANIFCIGWGTNDSKTGVSSLEQFEDELNQRITEIKTQVPRSIIICNSDPIGTSIYENNDSYYRVMKKIARQRKIDFFDIAQLYKQYERSTVVADDVHPNQYGYDVGGEALCVAYAIPNTTPVLLNKNNTEFLLRRLVPYNKTPITGGVSDFTNTFVNIGSVGINLYTRDIEGKAKLCLASASDLTDAAFQLVAEFYDRINNTGNVVETVTIDESYITVIHSTGSIIRTAVVVLSGFYTTYNANAKSVKLTLKGKNYQLRASGAQHIVCVKLL